MTETDQSENISISNDMENLNQKICDLEAELEGYRNFIFQLQKHSQCSEAIITVLCGTEGAPDGSNKPKGSADEEEMTFSSLHQVRYVKHMKILHPLAPEVADGRMLESLKQRLLDQGDELQKEQNVNLELFSEIHNLQNKFRDLSPSRYTPPLSSPHVSLQSTHIATGQEPTSHRERCCVTHGLCSREGFAVGFRQPGLGRSGMEATEHGAHAKTSSMNCASSEVGRAKFALLRLGPGRGFIPITW